MHETINSQKHHTASRRFGELTELTETKQRISQSNRSLEEN